MMANIKLWDWLHTENKYKQIILEHLIDLKRMAHLELTTNTLVILQDSK